VEIYISKASENHLFIRFPYDAGYIDNMRQIPGARWDKPNRAWKIGYTYLNVERFMDLFDGCPVTVDSELGQECEPLVERFGENKEESVEQADDARHI
jgi:hypothetical protein